MSDPHTSRRHRPATATVAVDRTRSIRENRPTQTDSQKPARAGGLLPGFALCVLLAGCLAGLIFGFQSDTFRIAHIEISGASPAVEQQIEDAIVPGCLETTSGVVDCLPGMLGPNELTFNSDEIQQQLERTPAIKSVRVRPLLPNRLSIVVTERQPEIAWLVGPDTYRVAADGIVIDRGVADGLKLRIGQVGGEAVKPGDQVDVNVIKGAELLQDHLASDFGITPLRIQYSPSDGLAVVGDQEMIAMFGPPQDLNLKMAELQRIVELAKGQKRPLAFVDLRYKTPYFRTN
jgi:cell division septal protein FtsQ